MVEQLHVEQSASQVQFWSVVKSKFSRADVLCSNAGIDPGNATVEDIDPELWCTAMVYLMQMKPDNPDTASGCQH